MRFGDDQDAQSQGTGKSFVRWSILIANKTILIVLPGLFTGSRPRSKASIGLYLREPICSSRSKRSSRCSPHLFPPPAVAGEDEGGGLNGSNWLNVLTPVDSGSLLGLALSRGFSLSLQQCGLTLYCGIGCLRNHSTRKSPRERIFCGVGFPGEKTRDSG